MNGKFNRLARVMLAKNDLKRALDSIGITSAVMRIDEDELIGIQATIHSWIDQLGELEKKIAEEISTKRE